MKKQKETTNKTVKHCVVFLIKDGNGQVLFDYLKKDEKLRPIYHWKQGEWNEKDKV